MAARAMAARAGGLLGCPGLTDWTPPDKVRPLSFCGGWLYTGHVRTVAKHWITWVFVLVGCSRPTSSATSDITTYNLEPTTGVPEPTLVTSTTGTPGESTTTSDSDGTSGSTTGTHPTTTGILPDFGADGPDCGGKIDILFALDRHFYVEEYYDVWEASLEVALPQFVEWFAAFDTHWMVSTPHEIWGIKECEAECAANDGATCWPAGPPAYPCAYDDLDTCDTTRGAGLTFPAGWKAANKRCEIAGGNRFISSTEEPDLLAALQCITDTGWTSHGGAFAERGMLEALKPTAVKVPGGCNLGFLRDDALLLVVLFSRYGGVGTSLAGPPEQWAADLLAAKNGDPSKLAVLGIVTDQSLPGGGVCEELVEEDFYSDVERFLHHHTKHFVHGSICSPSYAEHFEQAMTLALGLCGQEPPT